MNENITESRVKPDLGTLEPPLSHEEVTKILARVCIDLDDQRTPQEIATAMVLRGSVTL